MHWAQLRRLPRSPRPPVQSRTDAPVKLTLVARSPQAVRTLVAVKENGLDLQHAPQEALPGKEVVLAAAVQNIDALRSAAEEIEHDEELVVAASRKSRHAPRRAAEELEGVREVIMAAGKISLLGVLLSVVSLLPVSAL